MGSIADIDAALKLAVDLGATVLNLSFGTPASAVDPSEPRPHAAAVSYAARRGCTLVAASGNRGDRIAYYPAVLPEVIDADGCGTGVLDVPAALRVLDRATRGPPPTPDYGSRSHPYSSRQPVYSP